VAFRLSQLRLPKHIPKWVWILAGIVIFGEEKERVQLVETLQAGQVPAVLTPANASEVAAAIVSALRAMGRGIPRQESWLFPLAVSSFETDVPPRSWRQLYNFNVGNVTSTGKHAWYENPHVGPSYKFRSYASLEAGALGMLKAMQHAGALDAADQGDMALFCEKMTAYASGYAVAAPGLQMIADGLRGTIVEDVS
jgi:hypothetical protein